MANKASDDAAGVRGGFRRPNMRVETVSWQSSTSNKPMTSTFLVSPSGALSPLSSGAGVGSAFGFDDNATKAGPSGGGDDGSGSEELVYVDEDDDEVAIEMENSDSGSGEVPAHAIADAALTPGSLAVEQRSALEQVMNVLLLPEMLARALLVHFKWDTPRLLERYTESPEAALKLVGWDESATASAGSAAASTPAGEAGLPLDMCLICAAENVPRIETTAVACGHRFCNACWEGFLSVKIRDGEVDSLTCMGDGCTEPVHESVVKLLCSPEIFSKYQSYMLRDFVASNHTVAWCPAPGCSNAVKFEMAAEATCACGFRFCTLCVQECHIPLTCAQLRDWNKVMSDENATMSWIETNCKPCPRCLKYIEKNQGCNHMTCRQTAGGCGHEFCWLCGGDWRGHVCSVQFDEAGQPRLPNGWPGAAKAASGQDIKKILFYGGRFKAHMESGKREIALGKTIERRIASYRRRHPERAHLDWGFVAEAAAALVYCRQTIAYTFAAAFYLEHGSAERNLYEYLLEQLNERTEALSEALGQPLRKMDLRRVKDLTRGALRRMRHLIDGSTSGGLTTDANDRKMPSDKKPWWRRG